MGLISYDLSLFIGHAIYFFLAVFIRAPASRPGAPPSRTPDGTFFSYF